MSLSLSHLLLPMLAPRTTPGTCGLGTSTDPDCQHVDMGSCGNACCKMSGFGAGTADDVVGAIQTALAKGGPDGAFTAAKTWGDFFNLTDGCRKLNPAETTNTYLCQATHMTSGPYHFNDTINILVGPTSASKYNTASVELFSVSQIAGARTPPTCPAWIACSVALTPTPPIPPPRLPAQWATRGRTTRTWPCSGGSSSSKTTSCP